LGGLAPVNESVEEFALKVAPEAMRKNELTPLRVQVPFPIFHVTLLLASTFPVVMTLLLLAEKSSVPVKPVNVNEPIVHVPPPILTVTVPPPELASRRIASVVAGTQEHVAPPLVVDQWA